MKKSLKARDRQGRKSARFFFARHFCEFFFLLGDEEFFKLYVSFLSYAKVDSIFESDIFIGGGKTSNKNAKKALEISSTGAILRSFI